MKRVDSQAISKISRSLIVFAKKFLPSKIFMIKEKIFLIRCFPNLLSYLRYSSLSKKNREMYQKFF